MTKITARDYIEAGSDLRRAGFVCIRSLLEEGDKSIAEVATTYGIDERTVEVVKTTGSFTEFETVIRLETQREELETELAETKKEEARVKPKTWHYVVAGIILVAMLAGVIWFIAWLIGWVGGLL